MRRRRSPAVPVELPASLRVYTPSQWRDPSDPAESAEGLAHGRWTQARIDWCHEHDIDFVDLLRQQVRERRRRERQLLGGLSRG